MRQPRAKGEATGGLARHPPFVLTSNELGVPETLAFRVSSLYAVAGRRHPIGKLVFLPKRIGYVPDAADDAWRRVFAFFDERLGAGQSPERA